MILHLNSSLFVLHSSLIYTLSRELQQLLVRLGRSGF